MAVWTGRPLRLRFAPDAAHAAEHAAGIVAAARQLDGVELDYSPASLEHVDQIVENMRQDGVGSDEVAETLWGFGCYVGEVFVRNVGAEWIDTPEELLGMFSFPIVVRCADGQLTNPIGKVFKRIDNGEEDYLPFFYGVFTAS